MKTRIPEDWICVTVSRPEYSVDENIEGKPKRKYNHLEWLQGEMKDMRAWEIECDIYRNKRKEYCLVRRQV